MILRVGLMGEIWAKMRSHPSEENEFESPIFLLVYLVSWTVDGFSFFRGLSVDRDATRRILYLFRRVYHVSNRLV